MWSPDGPVLLEGVPLVFRSQLKTDGLFGSFFQWHIPSLSNSQSSGPENENGKDLVQVSFNLAVCLNALSIVIECNFTG